MGHHHDMVRHTFDDDGVQGAGETPLRTPGVQASRRTAVVHFASAGTLPLRRHDRADNRYGI